MGIVTDRGDDMKQISLFDAIPQDHPDFHGMSDVEIVDYIALAVGVDFRKVEGYELYKGKSGNIEITIGVSKYTFDERKDEPFISCNVWDKKIQGGEGKGCDSIKEVIEMLRQYV